MLTFTKTLAECLNCVFTPSKRATAKKYWLKSQSGQATVEYLIVCTAIVVAGLVITVGAQSKCVTNIKGDLTNCTSANEAVQSAFRKNIEDITFLINLPF